MKGREGASTVPHVQRRNVRIVAFAPRRPSWFCRAAFAGRGAGAARGAVNRLLTMFLQAQARVTAPAGADSSGEISMEPFRQSMRSRSSYAGAENILRIGR